MASWSSDSLAIRKRIQVIALGHAKVQTIEQANIKQNVRW